MRLANESMLVE